jgi:site-specific DNA recombinase
VFNRATGRRGVSYDYFVCGRNKTGTCDLPHLPVPHVEDAVTRLWGTLRLSDAFIADVHTMIREVLDDATTSSRLAREQLTTQLAALQRQEDNLVDLAANGSLPTGTIRTRLTRIATERTAIQAKLADTPDRLAEDASVIQAQLDLLAHPDEIYLRLTDTGRRLINQAVLDQILIDAVTDPTDAHHAAGHAAQDDEGPAVSGGPSAINLPRMEQGGGWNKPCGLSISLPGA